MWTHEQLSPENRDYIDKLPKGPKIVGDFSIAHGAFHDEDEYVFSPALAYQGLLESPTAVTFFGHTHIQGGFTLRGDDVSVLSSRPVARKRFFPAHNRTGNEIPAESRVRGAASRWRSARGIRDRGPATSFG